MYSSGAQVRLSKKLHWQRKKRNKKCLVYDKKKLPCISFIFTGLLFIYLGYIPHIMNISANSRHFEYF